ncbi:hypothetical protein [Nocardioides gilvus]|uniref:hypothetical protein n=1 Tax=Nocardioides gilvus TaxID=1735589 RepID=UPI001EF4D83C|nr:hypothetical protein [Nocardioides gilvus]
MATVSSRLSGDFGFWPTWLTTAKYDRIALVASALATSEGEVGDGDDVGEGASLVALGVGVALGGLLLPSLQPATAANTSAPVAHEMSPSRIFMVCCPASSAVWPEV